MAEEPIVETPTVFSSSFPNPGPFELLHRETRDVFPTNHFFDGAKFEIGRGYSQAFQATHKVSLGSSVLPSSYSYQAVYASNKGFLFAEMDSASWNLNARANHHVNDDLLLKASAQMTANGNQYLAEAEYTKNDFSANAKFVNPNILDRAGVFVFSYLQSVTRRLVLGVEAMTVFAPGFRPATTGLTFVSRYADNNCVYTGNFTNTGGVQLSYYQKVSDSISLGAELEAAVEEERRESVFTAGAKFDLRTATIRTQLDSLGRVMTVLEEKLAPGLSLLLAAELDHAKTTSRFGVGLTLQA